MVRAGSVEGDVGKAVLAGRRAVRPRRRVGTRYSLPPWPATRAPSSSPASWTRRGGRRCSAVEHPEADQRVPGQAFARSTLALVAVERGVARLGANARGKGQSLVGRLGSSGAGSAPTRRLPRQRARGRRQSRGRRARARLRRALLPGRGGYRAPRLVATSCSPAVRCRQRPARRGGSNAAVGPRRGRRAR